MDSRDGSHHVGRASLYSYGETEKAPNQFPEGGQLFARATSRGKGDHPWAGALTLLLRGRIVTQDYWYQVWVLGIHCGGLTTTDPFSKYWTMSHVSPGQPHANSTRDSSSPRRQSPSPWSPHVSHYLGSATSQA